MGKVKGKVGFQNGEALGAAGACSAATHHTQSSQTTLVSRPSGCIPWGCWWSGAGREEGGCEAPVSWSLHSMACMGLLVPLLRQLRDRRVAELRSSGICGP